VRADLGLDLVDQEHLQLGDDYGDRRNTLLLIVRVVSDLNHKGLDAHFLEPMKVLASASPSITT
jgi:hypothetical protein